MALDFTKPATTDNYSSAFVPNILANQIAQAQWLDSVQAGTITSPPTYAKRFNRTSTVFEEWGGSSWAELTVAYAKKSGTTFTGAVTFSAAMSVATITGTLLTANIHRAGSGSNGFINIETGDATHTGTITLYAANGIRQGYIGFSTSTGTADQGTISFVMNNALFSAVTSTNFIGPGTGLTGTAAGLSIGGNAATAGGLVVSTTELNNVANRIVRTDASGYIQASWINTISGDNGATPITRIYASSDQYLRYYTLANVASQMAGVASGTWGINVTGNSNTTSQTTWSNLNTTNVLNAQGNQAAGIGTVTGSLGGIMVQGNGTNAAFMAFHRPSAFAAYFGIDTDNQWAVGGWSMGAVRYRILHEGNYNTFSPTLTGGGAFGTWNINVLGFAQGGVTGGNVTAGTGTFSGVVKANGGSKGYGNISTTTTTGTPSGGAAGDFVFVY